MKNYLIFLCVLAFAVVTTATDYCAKPCQREVLIQNIGCGHNNKFAESCPPDATMLNFNDAMKDALVEAHNVHRDFIAGGGGGRFRPACRMSTMEWDDELAYLAELNVKTCLMEHDDCHVTDEFDYSGQNLYLTTSEDKILRIETIRKMVDNWFSEIENTTKSYFECYPIDDTLKIGHVTVMMADRNTRVGCAAVSLTKYFPDTNHDGMHTMVACNYATDNILSLPIYDACDTPGELCQSGPDDYYRNLCSICEEYNVNVFDFAKQLECKRKNMLV